MIQDRRIVMPAVLLGFVVVVICSIIAFVKPNDNSNESVATDSCIENLEETDSSFGSSTESRKGVQDQPTGIVQSMIVCTACFW